MSATNSSNILELQAHLSTFVTDNLLVLTVITNQGDQEPCLVHVSCAFCTNYTTCSAYTEGVTRELHEHQNLTKYGAELEYRCGLGQAFIVDNETTVEVQGMACQWDEMWTPTDQLMSCKCK